MLLLHTTELRAVAGHKKLIASPLCNKETQSVKNTVWLIQYMRETEFFFFWVIMAN